MIKISVILPVYNEELYLKQCLKSLCDQTLKEIEIICVDDGSTDQSLSILYEYQERDQRIKVFTQKNKYAGAARNYGLQRAKGEYLIFLDSDDFFQHDMLEKLYKKANDDQLDIALCRYDFYDDIKGQRKAVDFSGRNIFLPLDMEVFSGKDLCHAGIFQVSVGWAWDKLLKSTFIKECGYLFPEFRSSEDGFFVYMLMAKAKRIGVLNERLVFHRINNMNSLSNTKELNWKNGFRMLELTAKELQSQGIYNIYERSFVSFAVEFQVWYLQSMHDKQAFYNCYMYIREYMEPEFRFMEFREGFLCSSDIVLRYHQVLELEFDDLLFLLMEEKNRALQKKAEKGWLFPYNRIPRNCRLIIYGAGEVGQDYRRQLVQTEYCSKVYMVDRNYKRYMEEDFLVENPENIKNLKFDYIIISILDKDTQKKVRNWLHSTGIEDNKIVCM